MLKLIHLLKACALFSISVAISACAPETYVARPVPETVSRPPPVTLYMYPAKNQTPAQQDRDRYECHLWAVKQSGYDPGAAQLAPNQRIEVRSATPPGSDVAAGAVSGAVLGTILSPRHDNGAGTVFGAITGAMIGASSEQAKQQRAENIQQQYNEKEQQRYAVQERQARNYIRAMTACAEGRGYTVR